MPLKPHPTDPDKMVFVSHRYDLQSHANEYERGFIDGMQKQMQSSVDKAVNSMGKREWVELKDKPVAWGMEKDGVILDVICPEEHEREEGEYTTPLYTTPQRTCVRLTKEEINEGLLRSFYVLEKARAWRDGVAWAMQQLKDKNNV